MKPEIFQASIEKGSNKLYLESDRNVATRNGAFIKLGPNDIFYRVESSEKINIKRKFTFDSQHLVIKGNFDYRLFMGDNAKITFEECIFYVPIVSLPATIAEKCFSFGFCSKREII